VGAPPRGPPPQRMLRIGCVKYLNARPLIRGWPGEVEFDHPSALCERLANGELDVALVSSFEFLRNPIYRIIDDVSISSDGPVYSVVVAHRYEISKIDEIELDPASETAVNLLRCLLGELGLNPHLKQRSTGILPVGPAGVSPAVVKPGSAASAQLLIGDQAIHFRESHADEFQFWDLGEQWKKLMGLPFVYALWLIRPEVVAPKQIADRLRGLRDENLGHLNELIADVVGRVGLSRRSPKAEVDAPGHAEITLEFLSSYYHQHLRFSFGKAEKEGLWAFAHLCAKRGLLAEGGIAFDLV
jgi:chorismate dehydratase